MIIECSSCGSKYKYDESKLVGSVSKKVKCPKCKGVIEVKNPDMQASEESQAVGASMDRTYSSVPGAQPVAKPETAANPLDNTGGDPTKTAKVKREMIMGNSGPAKQEKEDESLSLPEYRKYSLAVIQGANSGEIFQISKPKMVIGRSDSDIVIKDLESSRQHAQLEVMGDRVILRDLNSTNGTWVDDERIANQTLENHSEFRIGTTVLMLIITELD